MRLVEITILQGHLRPVRLSRQALRAGAGSAKTADTGKQFRADADVLAKLQRQVLARHAQLLRQAVHAHLAGCAFDGRDGVVGRTGLAPWRRGAQAQQQIILQNGNSLRIRQGLAPQRVTEACRQLAAPQLLQSRAAIAQFAQGQLEEARRRARLEAGCHRLHQPQAGDGNRRRHHAHGKAGILLVLAQDVDAIVGQDLVRDRCGARLHAAGPDAIEPGPQGGNGQIFLVDDHDRT